MAATVFANAAVHDTEAGVAISLDQATYVALSDFNLVGIIGHLSMTKVNDTYQFAWDGSFGVQGAVRAKRASVALHPGKPGSAHREASPD